MLEQEVDEFVILPGGSNNEVQDSNDSYRWTHGDTLIFLDFYEIYRKQVGSLRIKSIKKMFEEISKEIKIKTGKNITPSNCENRWRVLKRAYKKYILYINKTGSARKDFEYADAMHKILGKKKNIHPEIVLSSETVDPIDESSETPQQENSVLLNDVEATPKRNPANKIAHSKSEYRNKTLKCQLLKEIRLNRQQYYEKRLAQEDKKIEENIRQNNLLEERNEILRKIGNRCPLSEDLLRDHD